MKDDSKKSVGGVLPELARLQGWERQLDLHSFFPDWKNLVDEELASYARPWKIERDVLWLVVENSAWIQQFQYRKQEVLEIINSRLRLSRLRDIRMVLPKDGDDFKEEDEGPKLQFVRPAPKDVEAFHRQVEIIEDDACREALMQFWYLAHACRRKDEK